MFRTGWIVFAVGGTADLLLHSLAHEWDPLQTPFGPAGHLAHLVTFAGMVLTVLGLCAGVFRQRNADPEEPKLEGSDI